ncbi:hypothetical protein, partial [Ferrovibrio sp.]|uniref:hypothetical protein n=1 Tax=Ferrovibrio sp. TaxID=1917215 RepID=UPI00262FD5D1
MILSRRDDTAVHLAPILVFVVAVSCCFGVAMLAPRLLDVADGHAEYAVCLSCAAGPLFVGAGLAIA